MSSRRMRQRRKRRSRQRRKMMTERGTGKKEEE